MDALWNSLAGALVTWGGRVVLAAVVLFIGWLFARWVGRLTRRALERAKFDATLARFIGKFARWSVLVLIVLACLSVFGIQTTSFAAVIGSAGIAIGLAFQGALGNFAAGLMLLAYRPFRVGDTITVAGQTGKVNEIELFSTTLDTFDNRRVIVPNGSIINATIENITFHPRRRAEVDVGVAYSADIDRTREVLLAAATGVTNVLEDPAPGVVLLGLGASAVNWSVRVWAEAANFGDVKQATIRAVKVALDGAGIEIPFPQMDVRVTQQSSS